MVELFRTCRQKPTTVARAVVTFTPLCRIYIFPLRIDLKLIRVLRSGIKLCPLSVRGRGEMDGPFGH